MKEINRYLGRITILVVLFFLSLATTASALSPLFGKKKAKKEIQEKPSDYKKN